ncbi:DUF2283 domain-containing protein [Desulfofundulus thermobenzoicus]|uniref:DUF2283 domain-containing protein n=1 Tax=Desulfofundulus thermobenzoicus TaxID=29376 RepID=A0A6N7IPY3_9FIRM|nr:DUF2283 domain-containing protein [Desulfofundulus thermobenzoicus]MQL51629.1 DUF2283 domain-containing protein [Desulfofundulus thermobenzoicus]
MRLRYDPEADALYIRFKEGKIEETDEVSPGVLLDLDANGNPLGLEILYASIKLGKPPLTVELEIPETRKQKAL